VEAADLTIAEASALIANRGLSASELVSACLARIGERDGTHSHEGDPASVNAWVRVYGEAALVAAARADRERPDPPPPLWGIPVGLKDLYAVAGEPLTASSSLLDERPEVDSDVWARLRAHGMILLGHTHTHEFAWGGTTDQVGNPWALDRSAGGSSGGSAAALAARMVPATTGTDTAGSLRIPSALCGTSTIKPSRGLVSLRGVVPLAPSLDHAGPMARTLEDCALLLGAMTGHASVESRPRAGARPLAGVRLALSPRVGAVTLDPDVAAGFATALALCEELGADLVEPPPPPVTLDVGMESLDIAYAEWPVFHKRFDDRREGYRPSLREWCERSEERNVSPRQYLETQQRRQETTAAFAQWLADERISGLVEPTVPCVAPVRGNGYDHAATDFELISLTHYWDWVGSPVVALPVAIGARSGLPVSVSVIGPPSSDWRMLDIGIQLQAELGVPDPYARS
jgi:aspartyl-tRNA(Asn)/glutamyl-tRNA(Gln) amidotransferase subunit A